MFSLGHLLFLEFDYTRERGEPYACMQAKQRKGSFHMHLLFLSPPSQLWESLAFPCGSSPCSSDSLASRTRWGIGGQLSHVVISSCRIRFRACLGLSSMVYGGIDGNLVARTCEMSSVACGGAYAIHGAREDGDGDGWRWLVYCPWRSRGWCR